MIEKTLAEFRRAVTFEAAIGGAVGAGETFRHPLEDIDQELNSAYASFREELVTRDFGYFIEETEQDDLPTDRADDNEQYSLVDIPTNVIRIKRVDVLVRSRWESLDPIDWERVRDVLPQLITATAAQLRPRFFSVKQWGTTSSYVDAQNVTTYEQVGGKMAFLPFATPGVWKMSYLPIHVAVLDEDELFIFPDEVGYRWCVWEAVTRIAVRDRNAGKRYDYAQQQRAVCEQKIGRFVPRAVDTGPTSMHRSRRYNG
jgi:hypothetical protein